MPFLTKNNAPSTSLHSTVARTKSEPQKRDREQSVSSSVSTTVSRSRSVPNLDNAKKDVDDNDTDTNSDDDFVDQSHNPKKVKVEENDDEEDDLPDPDDLLDEIDLHTWKLMEIDSIKTKFEGELAPRNSTQANRMAHNKIRDYLDKMTEVMELKEIPKENKLEDYIIRLDPPTNNEEYNSLMDNVEKQLEKRNDSTVPLFCPVKKCPSTFLLKGDITRHISGVHFNWSLFKCKCGELYRQFKNLKHHIMAKHFDMKYECSVCLGKYSRDWVQFHARLGHVNPEGQLVFSSPAKTVIKMRLFHQIDVTVGGGCTYQIYAIPWVNEFGILVDVSVDLTRFSNIQEIARLLDEEIVRACENGGVGEKKNWVRGCGSARQERAKGRRMRPDLAFGLGLFGVSLVVAFQLKSFSRLYFDAVKIMATEESKYFLQNFNDHIKSTLNNVMDHPSMPEKTRKHVELTGASFNLRNSQ